MKKNLIYFFSLLSVLLLGACSDDDKETTEGAAHLEVNPTSLYFSSQESSQTLQVKAGKDWAISGASDWLSVSAASGTGDSEVSVSVTQNTTDQERKQKLVIKSGDKLLNIPVVQLPEGELTIEDKVYVLTNGKAQNVLVPYFSNMEPEVVVSPEGASWITILETKAVAEHRVVLGVAENKGELREAEVYLTCESVKDTVLVKQYPDPYLNIEQSLFTLNYNQTSYEIVLDCNIPLETNFTYLSGETEWFNVADNKTENGKTTLQITCPENIGKKLVEAELKVFNTDCGLERTLKLVHNYKANDGDLTLLQKATYTPSWSTEMDYKIPGFVFAGDGFTLQDMEDGTYDKYMKEAYEAIFSHEPYKSLSNRFNVWIYYGISNEDGVTTVDEYEAGKMRDTRFKVYQSDRNRGFSIQDFDGVVAEVKERIESDTLGGHALNHGKVVFDPSTNVVVLVAKIDVFGGTCVLNRSTGASIGLIPLCTGQTGDSSFGQTMTHEIGGHGFGRLADEYGVGEPISPSQIRELKAYQEKGYYMNMSLEKDPKKVPWSFLIGQTGYEDVGVYEGGFYANADVWRSTVESIMRGQAEFSPYQRFLIFERCYKIYDNPFDIPFVPDVKEAFFTFDKPNIKN